MLQVLAIARDVIYFKEEGMGVTVGKWQLKIC